VIARRIAIARRTVIARRIAIAKKTATANTTAIVGAAAVAAAVALVQGVPKDRKDPKVTRDPWVRKAETESVDRRDFPEGQVLRVLLALWEQKARQVSGVQPDRRGRKVLEAKPENGDRLVPKGFRVRKERQAIGGRRGQKD
jgi:hypothetical protein